MTITITIASNTTITITSAEPPAKACRFRATSIWRNGMLDVRFNWTREQVTNPGTPDSFQITLSVDGAAAGSISVPVTAAGDSGGYSCLYSAGGGPALNAGDTVMGVNVPTDSVNNLKGPPSTASCTVTNPPVAPAAAVDFTATPLSS